MTIIYLKKKKTYTQRTSRILSYVSIPEKQYTSKNAPSSWRRLYDSGRCDDGAGVLRVAGFREAATQLYTSWQCKYNGRTLRLDHYLTKLEVEYGHIN